MQQVTISFTCSFEILGDARRFRNEEKSRGILCWIAECASRFATARDNRRSCGDRSATRFFQAAHVPPIEIENAAILLHLLQARETSPPSPNKPLETPADRAHAARGLWPSARCRSHVGAAISVFTICPDSRLRGTTQLGQRQPARTCPCTAYRPRMIEVLAGGDIEPSVRFASTPFSQPHGRGYEPRPFVGAQHAQIAQPAEHLNSPGTAPAVSAPA